ncbi:MAG: GAF domain-containing protein [Anaerolineae bacterium]|nr:GAF domain-containing protein [Anaerolineae bacterium]
MPSGGKNPRILIIAPTDDASLRVSLEKQYGLVVRHQTSGQAALAVLQTTRLDLVVLNANLADPPASTLLAQLTAQEVDLPVVLVGANGKSFGPDRDFNYPNIIGWLNQPFTPAELASVIHSALASPPSTSDLVLAKRAELVEANQQLTQRVQELETLFKIGKSVTALLDLEAVLSLLVKSAVKLAGADEAYLLLVDETSGDLYLRAQTNLGIEATQDFRIRVNDSISGQVVKNGEPIILARDSNSLKVKTGLTVYSLVNVPVKVGPEVIGVLGVDNRRQTRAFTGDDQKLLSALADWAAIAIQNARLYATTKEFSRDLKLINHVSRLVSSTLDVEQIPRLLIQRTAEIFEAECGSLALVSEEKGGVIFQAAYDGEGHEIKTLRDFLMPFGEGIIGTVAQTGIPHLVNNAQQDPGWSPVADRLTGFTTKKLIAVPLIAEGKILGVMELLNKKEGDFGQRDVELLLLVAASAAIALRNAQQYTALMQSNAALREAQARRIAAERWAVLGKAAGNLAHRINNTTALVPMTTQYLAELLQQVDMSPDLRKEVDENLGRIERNTLYTVDLAMALLRRFRHQPAEAQEVNELVKRALASIEIPANIKVVCHLDPDLPAVNTSDLLVDIFVELITNAVQAMTQTVSLLRIASFAVGNCVSVQVTDNGPGIPKDKLGQIFDMFYTTNPRGLGFGLWWVKTFLEQQGGEITVESQPNQGTTFTVTLPCNPLPHPPPLRSWTE